MRAKAKLMGDTRSMRKIEGCKSPGQAKMFGRRVTPFDQAKWELNCDEIMMNILVAKFTSTSSLKEYILSVKGDFYEASPTDKIWGIGISVEAAERGEAHNGQNRLGVALGRARAIIQIDSM
tara:strand:+ start:2605 stop:2970 length:366 start_codon:yes stop_codon:yes gene_type:complete